MSAAYRGRPWRSRFLRAPAIALRLAEREDFVPLGSVADVSLGLKTGADGFFFLRLAKAQNADDLGRPRARSTVHVSGTAWEGEISRADLRAALLNPHRLQDERGRAFLVPKRSDVAYLAPQDREPRAGLADYVAVGEREGLPKRRLIASNAAGKRWYRQRREPVDWPWVLPYNSAYDYGAHDNRARLVLNGRFLGCRPRDGVDSELLGAALNTTFVVHTRLLEGTSTGSEGAYDIGAPAARLMQVPDPRALESRAEEIGAILDDWRERERIPPAPDRAGLVLDQRRRLDTVVLEALGATPGEAAYELERCYEAYGRWRAAVEDVEARVQQNRRALTMSGRDRSESPRDLIARQIWDEIAAEAPLLPSSALPSDAELESVSVSSTFHAPPNEPLFEAGIVEAPNGAGVDLGSYQRVRYADMLLRLGFRAPLSIAKEPEAAERAVNDYEAALAKLDREATRRARRYIGSEQARETADAVLRMWRHACVAAGMDAGPAQS